MNRCRFCGRPDPSGECEKCAPTTKPKAQAVKLPRSVEKARKALDRVLDDEDAGNDDVREAALDVARALDAMPSHALATKAPKGSPTFRRAAPTLRAALRVLSCAALEALTNCQRSGVTAPEADEAQELLRRRECEGNCPCLSCSEEV